MTAIPILSGIYSDTTPNLRTSYPKNMVPIIKDSGISKGYLKPASGIIQFNNSNVACPGIDRGGVVWNGLLYRVLGSKLCLITADGSIKILADVGNDLKPVSIGYSFDKMYIGSAKSLFYWNGTLTKVTDNNLGIVIDVIWMDGYYVTTDGINIIVTNLADPTTVNPLAYGSPLNEPSQIYALEKFREELYCFKRFSISVYDNVGNSSGTSYFPFQVNNGALISRGCVGTKAKCLFNFEYFVFVGGGVNEPISIYAAINGQSNKISTREIDTILEGYTELQLSTIVIDQLIDKENQFLYIHLPDRTIVYDAKASEAMSISVWFYLSSSLRGYKTYQARFILWAYGVWISGDPTQARLGYFTDYQSDHYGVDVEWMFGTTIIYNSTMGVLFHELELILLAGKMENDANSTVYTSYSTDLQTWSREYPRSAGKIGNRNIRLNWLQQGNMRNMRVQRFRGLSDAHLAIASIEARMEALNA